MADQPDPPIPPAVHQGALVYRHRLSTRWRWIMRSRSSCC